MKYWVAEVVECTAVMLIVEFRDGMGWVPCRCGYSRVELQFTVCLVS